IVSEFQRKLTDTGIDNAIIQVNEWADGKENEISELISTPDCMTSRTLTVNGVFSCPFLANDYRGRSGSEFKNYSKTTRLDTSYCGTCQRNKDKMFSVDIDW
ncbi:MAG: hypothetical protein K6E29_06475, partial [Cyanobacteria bacterium RUI128]|nr:hypothetical protein [Cyanobacteria bacterium RUI128]